MTDPTEQADALTVRAALADVKAKIAAAAVASGRTADAVTLIAVSKSQPESRIVAALDAGERIFGENYVQEAKGRWRGLRERYPGVEVHMIGALQTNKAGEAVALFDVIQTVDREKLARALAKEMDKQGKRPRLLIQVNTGEEPQKAGIAPLDTDAFVRLCREELRLPVDGLMAIPPDGEDIAPHAALLAQMARRNGLKLVSVGMSADFEVAAKFGATHVRVGSAIFGARSPKNG